MPMIEITQSYLFNVHESVRVQTYYVNTDKVCYTTNYYSDEYYCFNVVTDLSTIEFSSKDPDKIQYYKVKEQEIIQTINKVSLSSR